MCCPLYSPLSVTCLLTPDHCVVCSGDSQNRLVAAPGSPEGAGLSAENSMAHSTLTSHSSSHSTAQSRYVT